MTNKRVAVIGAGVAGVSAAIYLKRSGLDFDLFEARAVGGQLLFVEQVDNYAGLPSGVKGRDMAVSLSGSLNELGVKPVHEEVESVSLENGRVSLNAGGKGLHYAGLIVATGASFKTLGAKGEQEFSGRGVSYCAICDGFFFKGKDVAVVGGGNTAVEEALYLSNIARKVYLIHRRDALRAMEYLQKEIHHKANIEIVLDSVIDEIAGRDTLEKIIVKNLKASAHRTIELNAVFVAVGVTPSTGILKDVVNMDEGGFILTDEEMKTSSDIIWACGDCRKRPLRQLVTAASEGAVAAISAYRRLKGGYISS
jgi:thioredoxin reductase (NADPH)